jgi:hypothetical protein
MAGLLPKPRKQGEPEQGSIGLPGQTSAQPAAEPAKPASTDPILSFEPSDPSKKSLVDALKKDYSDDLEKLDRQNKSKLDELKRQYLEDTRGQDIGDIAETIGHAMARFGAASAASKEGVMPLNLDLQKTDWEKRKSPAATMFASRLQESLQEQRDARKFLASTYLQRLKRDEPNAEDWYKKEMAAQGRAKIGLQAAGLEQRQVSQQATEIKNQIADMQKEQNFIRQTLGNKNMPVEDKASILGSTKEATSKGWFWDSVDEDKLREQADTRIKQLQSQIDSARASLTGGKVSSTQPAPSGKPVSKVNPLEAVKAAKAKQKK